MYNNVLSKSRIKRSSTLPTDLNKPLRSRVRDTYDHLNVSFASMDTWLRKHRKTPKFTLSDVEYACTRKWFMSLEQCRSGDGVPTSIISEAFFVRGVFATKAHADNMISSIDTDRSGALSYEEFMAAIDGSNLMQAGRIRKFLRSLVKEYPEIRKFYSSRPSTSVEGKSKKGRTKSTARVIPITDDVDNLHYLKSREAMMKMGVVFPSEEEEEAERARALPSRPVTAGCYGRHGQLTRPPRQTLRNEQGGSSEAPIISRSFRSDETYDRGFHDLPTISYDFASRLDNIEEGVASSLSPGKKGGGQQSFWNDKFETLGTATPPELVLSNFGPPRDI